MRIPQWARNLWHGQPSGFTKRSIPILLQSLEITKQALSTHCCAQFPKLSLSSCPKAAVLHCGVPRRCQNNTNSTDHPWIEFEMNLKLKALLCLRHHCMHALRSKKCHCQNNYVAARGQFVLIIVPRFLFQPLVEGWLLWSLHPCLFWPILEDISWHHALVLDKITTVKLHNEVWRVWYYNIWSCIA